MIPPRLIAWGAAIALLIGGVALIYRAGDRAGTAKVETRVERRHASAVAEARGDERAAAAVTAAIGARTANAEALTDTFVRHQLQEMRDALADVPLAPDGAPLPAAPVDRLRDQLNAGIARANRAADAGGAAGGADPR